MSSCRVTDLRHKEIINSADGCRLGYIDDVEIDTVTVELVLNEEATFRTSRQI